MCSVKCAMFSMQYLVCSVECAVSVAGRAGPDTGVSCWQRGDSGTFQAAKTCCSRDRICNIKPAFCRRFLQHWLLHCTVLYITLHYIVRYSTVHCIGLNRRVHFNALYSTLNSTVQYTEMDCTLHWNGLPSSLVQWPLQSSAVYCTVQCCLLYITVQYGRRGGETLDKFQRKFPIGHIISDWGYQIASWG